MVSMNMKGRGCLIPSLFHGLPVTKDHPRLVPCGHGLARPSGKHPKKVVFDGLPLCWPETLPCVLRDEVETTLVADNRDPLDIIHLGFHRKGG